MKYFISILCFVSHAIYVYLYSYNLISNHFDRPSLLYLFIGISLFGFISVIVGLFIVTFLLGRFIGESITLEEYFGQYYKILYFPIFLNLLSIILILLNLEELKSYTTAEDVKNFSQIRFMRISEFIIYTGAIIYLIEIISESFKISLTKAFGTILLPLIFFILFKYLL
jgi:hypothetical protein